MIDHIWVGPVIVTNQSHTHPFVSSFCNNSLVTVVLLDKVLLVDDPSYMDVSSDSNQPQSTTSFFK